MRMTSDIGMHMVIVLVPKGWSTQIAEALSDKIVGESRIFSGGMIMDDPGQKGFLGIPLKEDSDMIVSIAKTSDLDEVFQTAICKGNLDSNGGVCISVPISRIFEGEVKETRPKDGEEKEKLFHRD